MRPGAGLGYNPKGPLLVIYIHHLDPKAPSFHTLPNQQRKLNITRFKHMNLWGMFHIQSIILSNFRYERLPNQLRAPIEQKSKERVSCPPLLSAQIGMEIDIKR